MDLAANDLEKTSAVKREAMVSKLHNMQWLKNTSNSSSSVKAKSPCKQIKHHDKDGKVGNKVLAIEDSKVNSAEKSCENQLTMDTCIKDLSSVSVAKSDGDLCIKNMDTCNMLQNNYTLVMKKVEEEILSAAIQENYANKKQKHQESVSINKIDILQDETQNVECPNVPESQKIDHDTKELDLTGQSDKNNNGKSVMPDMLKEDILKSSENNKASTEVKDICIKKTNAIKTNIKSASNTTLSKCCNDKPVTPVKRSLFNLSKSPVIFNNRYEKTQRVNKSRHELKKNPCTKDESIKEHTCFPAKEAENKAKDIGKSDLPKTDLERESNKAIDINQSNQRGHGSPCTASLNKNKTLQTHQRTIPKQFTPKFKGQEFSRSNTSSTLNRTPDKSKVPEKATHVSKSSDSSLRESEKNIDKNLLNSQKPYVNLCRSTFTYKNSTLSRTAKTKSMSGNGYGSPYGRNSLYARNNINITPNKEHAGNAEYRAATKVKRNCLPGETLSNGTRVEKQSDANNLKADKKQQCEKNKDAQSANTRSTSIHKSDVSILNNESDENSTEDKKPANTEDCTKQISVTPERSGKSEKAVDNVKTKDTKQQLAVVSNKMDNEELKPSRDTFGLRLDKSYIVPQTYPMSPHTVKEDTQQTDASQTRNNPITLNDLSDPLASRRNPMSMQHSVQSMHLQQITHTENHMKQTSLRTETDSGRFYDQCLPMNDTTPLTQIPNTFDATMPYEYNVQATSSDNDIASMFDTMSVNRESSSVPHRYTSSVQQRPFTPLSDLPGYSMPTSQVSRWDLSLQDGYHMEQLVNATQPATMHVYSTAAFDQDDLNGAQVPAANYLPAHLLYTPYMQAWNSQLHYSMPVFHNSPCTGYTIVPNVTNPSSNYNDVNAGPISMCMHDQPPQHRYIQYMPANSNAMQMHTNPSYMKSMYSCDLNNCAVDTRNTAVNDGPMRPNRYRRYQDNYRAAYDIPQYSSPVSQPISRPQQQQQQPFIPANVNQYNIYGLSGQKCYKQNAMSFTLPPPSNSPKGQKTQDLVCEDNSLEGIPPIISPKEFMSNVNFSNKTDQFAPRMFKPDFKVRPNIGYRQQPSFHRHNNGGGFRKNTYQDFPKEYVSSVGRGISKASKNMKM